MTRFTWGDRLRVRADAPVDLRPRSTAWVVGVFAPGDRRGQHFEQFPDGVVYNIEYEDGSCVDVHEASLEPIDEE